MFILSFLESWYIHLLNLNNIFFKWYKSYSLTCPTQTQFPDQRPQQMMIATSKSCYDLGVSGNGHLTRQNGCCPDEITVLLTPCTTQYHIIKDSQYKTDLQITRWSSTKQPHIVCLRWAINSAFNSSDNIKHFHCWACGLINYNVCLPSAVLCLTFTGICVIPFTAM